MVSLLDRKEDPPVVAFVGYSGSGKTTLLMRVIPALKAREVRVGVIKHSSHRGIEGNTRGSDTQRFWDAGADVVALATPDRLAYWRRLQDELPLPDVLGYVGMSSSGQPSSVSESDTKMSVDLVLIEGYKRSMVPKIEVIRAACHPQPIDGLQQRMACVTDLTTLDLDCPTFGLDEVAGVVDLLLSVVNPRRVS